MSVMLNHTIVWCRDKKASARYLTEILGLEDAKPFGPFMVVEMGNGVSLDYHDFYDARGEILSSITRSWSPRTSSAKSSAASNLAARTTGRILG